MQFSKWLTLGFGAFCLVAVAGVLNAQHLYYMAAILLTLPGISYALGWHTLRGLEFTRELPSTAWEGEDGALVYVVRNRTRITRFFITIHEPLPAWIVPRDLEPPLFNVASGDETRVALHVRFQKRGVYGVQAFDVTAMDPLGVFAFTRRVPCEGELVVYPQPQPLRPVTITGADRFGWQEWTSAALRGSSVDPDGVRLYAPGDPLRRIHWRQTARTGKLSVIEFEESQAINLVLALDLQRGSEFGEGMETTLEWAVRLAASLAQQAIQQGASVRLIVPAETSAMDGSVSAGLLSIAGRGQEHLFLILDALARMEADSSQSVSAAIQESGGSLLPGTTLMVLTSQPDSDLPSALTRYTSTGSNVAVVYLDPNSFVEGRRPISEESARQFLAALLSARAQPFVLSWNEQGDLSPEAVVHVNL